MGTRVEKSHGILWNAEVISTLMVSLLKAYHYYLDLLRYNGLLLKMPWLWESEAKKCPTSLLAWVMTRIKCRSQCFPRRWTVIPVRLLNVVCRHYFRAQIKPQYGSLSRRSLLPTGLGFGSNCIK